MLDLFFSDDARQDNPTRAGMGRLVATGFVHVPGENVRSLEDRLEEIATARGFPKGPAGEFKYSPGRELWMRDNLIGVDRNTFFLEVIEAARAADVGVTFVAADRNNRTATGCQEHEEDVVRLLIERVDWRLRHFGRSGIVVVDRPSGGRTDEDEFLQRCLETISIGTAYVRPDRIAINVLSTPSRLVRCLQLADLVTSATLAFVSGEAIYSPPLFDAIKPMFHRDPERIGGIGVKIHPDLRYGNLYHWLLGDRHVVRGNTGTPLPVPGLPYFRGALEP